MSTDGSGLDTELCVALPTIEPEPDEAERSARQLRAGLTEPGVESVTPVPSGSAPIGVGIQRHEVT